MKEFQVWKFSENTEKYDKYISQCINISPYHITQYLIAEEKAEQGYIYVFLYKEDMNFAICTMVIKQLNSLPYLQNIDSSYRDMITPHEYAGIASNTDDISVKQNLLAEQIKYCKKNSIVSSFIRINPYFDCDSNIYRESGYQVELNNNQVWILLEQTEKQIVDDYKSNVKRNIKRAISSGLNFEIVEKNEVNCLIFFEMYQKAMGILKAKKFLFFNREYFENLLKCDACWLAFVRNAERKVIAAAIILANNKISYYHLGCFDRKYSEVRPMNYLIHSIILWSKTNGYDICHLGGGGKSLMQFKTGYSSSRIDYYIGKKIFSPKIYKEVMDVWRTNGCQGEQSFFPMYRSNEN